MTPVLIIVGIVFAAVGGGLLWAARNTQRKVAAMGAIATSSAGSVSSMYPGEPVEVQGTIRCDAPLTSELSGEPCAYFSTALVREYEEQDRDSNGRTRWNRRSETVASNTQRAPFLVEDETGAVAVDPEGADVDALQVVNRFEQGNSGFVIGGVPINVDLGMFSNRRTLGYRSTEHVLRLDSPVYVLGTVHEDRTIGCAPSGVKDRPFIVSYRSEEALTRDWQGSAKWMRIGGGLCAAIGVVLTLAGFILRMG